MSQWITAFYIFDWFELLRAFFLDKKEKVTIKKLLSKVLIGAPLCILLGFHWILEALGGYGEKQYYYRFWWVEHSMTLFVLFIFLAGSFFILYAIILVYRSFRRYAEGKKKIEVARNIFS